MLRPNYPIRTARLVLRPFEAGDLDDLCAYDARADVARYLLWEPRTRAQSRDALKRYRRQVALEREGDGIVLAVHWPDAGAVVGQVSLVWLSEQHRQGEVGFIVNPDHQGHGLATEAAAAMLALGFDQLRLHRIIGRCDARNHASARVMERLGMRCEAHLHHNELFKGEWGNELVYAMLEHEWRRHPAPLGLSERA